MSETATSTEQTTVPNTAPVKPKSDQIEIGALWKKEGRSQKFLSGTLDFKKNLTEAQWVDFAKTRQMQVVIFTNKFKQNERHPDLRIYVSKSRDQVPPAAPAKATNPNDTEQEAAVVDDGEII